MFERNNDLERKQLAPGVCITTLDAAKFNRCRITLHLRFPARRESATDAAVLALVLERGYAACPDMTALPAVWRSCTAQTSGWTLPARAPTACFPPISAASRTPTRWRGRT